VALPTFDARDAIAVSRVRERALQVIEQASRDSDAQVRANAVEAAGRSTRRLRGVIERGLEDTNPAVRSVAAMTVARSGLCDLASRAGVMASDRNVHAQASGIFALARCGQPVNVNPLADILLRGESMQVRSHAAFVLGELGNPSALPLLRRAVSEMPRNASPEEQRILSLQLAEAMVKLGATEQRQVLRAALYPSRPEELEAAALAVQILGQLRDRESVDQLVYLTAYRDERGNRYPAEIRLAVAAALANMGRPQGGFIADEFFAAETPTLRAQSAVVYGELRDRAFWGRLEALMADPNPLVRVAAAFGVLRSEEAAAPIR
jgi:HEAT repeat protein